MSLKITPHRYSRFTFCSRVISVFSVIVGLIVLLGWFLDVDYLKSIVPGFVTMKVNTALGFILAGIALRFLQPQSLTPRNRQIALISAGLVCLIGLLTLLEYGFQWNLGIDELLVKPSPDPMTALPPGRMSFLTALVLFLLGLALLLLGLERWGSKVAAQILALLTSIFPLVGLIGYLYNIQPLYQEFAFLSMALSTALTAELLCLGILLAQPDQGLMESFTNDHSGGVMARRLLPFIILAPIIIGWPRLLSLRGGFYDSIWGIVLVVLTFMLTFVIILWLNARSLNAMDTARERAEKALRESEERLRLATEATRMGTWDRDLTGNGLFWSPSMERLMGFEPGTFPGTYEAFAQLVHPEDWNVLAAAQQNARKNGGHYQAELRFVLRDSRVRWGLVYGQMLFDTQGTPTRLVGIDLDITERKQIEQALRESEERFRTLIEQASDGFFVHDTIGRFLDVNQRACESLGYSREELLQMNVFDVEQDYTLEEAQKVWTEICPGQASTLYGHHRRKDGTIFPVEVRWSCFDFRGQRLFLDLVRDITERKQAEDALRESEARHRAVTETASDAIITIDANSTIVFANQAAQRIFGYAPEELLGQPLTRLIPEHLRHRHETSIKRYGETRRRHIPWERLELPGLHRNGQEIPLEISFGEFTRDGQLYFTGIMRDITERKRAEQALYETNLKLQTFIQASPLAIVALGLDRKVTLWNPAAERMFGWTETEIMGQILPTIPEEEMPNQLALRAQFIRSGGTAFTNIETRRQRKDGSLIEVNISFASLRDKQGVMIGTMGIIADITERKRAEEALRESQQLLQAIINNSTAVIYVKDVQGRYLLVNRRYEELFHVISESMIGKTDYDLFTKEEADAFSAFDQRVVATHAPVVGEEVAPLDDGLHTYISVKCPLYDGAGNPYAVCGISTDITDLKRAEEVVRESQARLAGIISSAMDAIITIDEEQRITLFNAAAEKMFGCRAGDAVGQSLEQFIPERFRHAHHTHVQDFGRTNVSKRTMGSLGAIYGLRANGEEFPIEASISQIEIKGHKFFTIILRDITERIRAEEALRQSEEHFRVIFEGAGVGNVECEARTGRFLLVNRKMCEITGYAAEELLTMSFNDITYPEDRDKTFDLYRRFINKEMPNYTVEKRYVRKDGLPVWVQISSTLLCDEAGNPWRTVAVIQDISERKRAEEALRESEHNLATAQSVAHIGSWTAEVSETGELSSVIWSDETYRIFGSEPGGFTVTLEEFFRLVHPDDRESVQRAMEATLEGNAPYAHEHRILLPDGSIRILYEQAEILWNAQTGRPRKVIGTVQDITERRRVEEEIRLLNAGLEERVALRTEELAAANRELEAFAYSVSHDLRAPLRAIDGFSRILLEDFATGLPQEAEEHLRLVRDNTQQMGRLIDDLLGFSRLNRQALKKHRIATGDLVRQILADLHREYDGRRVEITIDELPDCYADQSLLKQVFINLLTNAFKFTSHCDKAKIHIGCLIPDPNGSPPVYFVKDNGVGFDMKYAHKLFQVFQRLHRAEDYEGTGVGLAIVQRVILRHGGRVWAEGAPNQGATFFFTLEGGVSV